MEVWMSNVSAIAFSERATSIEGDALVLDEEGKRRRAELIEAIASLHEKGVLQFGGSANASVRLSPNSDEILVTARGLPRDLTEEDFGIVRLDGSFVGGKLGKGVRSVIAMHTHAYRRPEVGAVIHTHSANATAFAVAHKPIPPYYEPLLNRGQKTAVPVSPYGDRNSGGLVHQLDAFLQEHPDTQSVLLANHGLLVFAENARKAADLTVTIEEAAALFIRAEAIGGAQPIFKD
jgi:ribulose-5-phosphate 4-epimerase/fuculose-1-phosphate aldolase